MDNKMNCDENEDQAIAKTDDSQTSALSTIGKNYLSMTDVERKIADYILKNPNKVINMPVRQISSETGVSDGSIIKFANQVGFNGFTQLKINIAQNLSNKNEIVYDRLCETDTPQNAMRKTFENAISALKQTSEFISNEDLQKTADLFMNVKGRLEFYGGREFLHGSDGCVLPVHADRLAGICGDRFPHMLRFSKHAGHRLRSGWHIPFRKHHRDIESGRNRQDKRRQDPVPHKLCKKPAGTDV